MEKFCKKFRLSIVSSAVLLAIASPSYAAIDGWDFSGQDARNQALGTNYFSTKNSYNIWVNPALLSKYSNRVDINVSDGYRDDESAGIFRTVGDSAWGIYIGRPSVSRLSNVSSAYSNTYGAPLHRISDFEEFGVTGEPTDPDESNSYDLANRNEDPDQPRNQFDLFWASKLGGIQYGARINFQAHSEDSTLPTYTEKTPNVFQSSDTARQTDELLNNDVSVSSSEFNFVFGFEIGAFDGSLQLGLPSGESSQTFSDRRTSDTLSGGNLTGRTTESLSASTQLETDGAQTLGIAFRWHLSQHTIASFSYEDRNNSYKNTRNGTTRTQTDSTGSGILSSDISVNILEQGSYKNESSQISMYISRAFTPVADTSVIATIGLKMYESNTGVQNRYVKNNTTNNLTGLSIQGATGNQDGRTDSFDRTSLPFVLAFEGKINSRWTARASVRKDLYLATELSTNTVDRAQPVTSATAETIEVKNYGLSRKELWDTDTTMTFGAGYTRGSVTIDAVVGKEFVTRGVGDNGLVSRVNLTWLMP